MSTTTDISALGNTITTGKPPEIALGLLYMAIASKDVTTVIAEMTQVFEDMQGRMSPLKARFFFYFVVLNKIRECNGPREWKRWTKWGLFSSGSTMLVIYSSPLYHWVSSLLIR